MSNNTNNDVNGEVSNSESPQHSDLPAVQQDDMIQQNSSTPDSDRNLLTNQQGSLEKKQLSASIPAELGQLSSLEQLNEAKHETVLDFGEESFRDYQDRHNASNPHLTPFQRSKPYLKQYLVSLFPPLEWVPKYQWKTALRGDLIAGITVGIMLIPQGIAYAIVAGVPPVYGLYASIIPLIVYAFFGTSRQLAVGPTALTALLVYEGVSKIAVPESEEYIGAVLLVSFLVGVIQIVLGLARLGMVANYLSHTVLSGFTTAAAIIIGVSQLKHVLGVSPEDSHALYEAVYFLAIEVPNLNGWTVLIGALSLLILLGFRFAKRKLPAKTKIPFILNFIPAPLVVVVLGIVFSFALDLENTAGIKVVGHVPSGLPPLSVPAVTMENIQAVLGAAITISFLGFIESIAVGSAFAKDYKIQPSQELVALGLVNFVGCFFSCHPTTGGFSRTAVNAKAGAESTLAGILSAIIVTMAVLFLTSVMYFLPKAVLAAIVLVAVISLFDFGMALQLWKTDRVDFVTWIIAFVATLAAGIELGIAIAVGVSLFAVVFKASRPHIALLGRLPLPGVDVFRNVRRYPEAVVYDRIVIARVDTALFYFNMGFITNHLRALLDREPVSEVLIIDCAAITNADSGAIHDLKAFITELKARPKPVLVLLASVNGPVRDKLRQGGVFDPKYINAERQMFWDITAAVTVGRRYVSHASPEHSDDDVSSHLIMKTKETERAKKTLKSVFK